MSRSLFSAPTTLFLFVKSDLLSILLPMILFGLGSSTSSVPIQAWAASIHWTLIHLLQFCISNQIPSIEEDTMNKPWRPLASNRLSVRSAIVLQNLLVLWCLVISWYHSAMTPSLMILITTWFYNNAGCGNHWFLKNATNVIGYVGFQLGAMTVLHGRPCSRNLVQASLAIGAVVMTTIHASDFADVEGDRALGRFTLPILYPTISRHLVFLAIMIATFSTSLMHPHPFLSEAFLILGGYLASRIMFQRTKGADRLSCYLYYIWLAAMHYTIGDGFQCPGYLAA